MKTSSAKVSIVRPRKAIISHHRGKVQPRMGPRVSVLMSVYNGELYLREAIESILQQSFNDFEFIIINDASTDNSQAIIESYYDTRIVLLNNNSNLGLAQSLNRGLDVAHGQYIARMDADDISLPERLQKQVAFMDENNEIGICGTWFKMFGNNPGWVVRYAVDHETIRSNLLFGPLLCHPSVIIRRDVLVDHDLHYDPAYDKAEDYALWIQCSRYCNFSNLAEELFLYRSHDSQISTAHISRQQESAKLVRIEELRSLGVQANQQEYDLHQAISIGNISPNQNFAEQSRQWIDKLRSANVAARYYPEPAFSQVLNDQLNLVCNLCRA